MATSSSPHDRLVTEKTEVCQGGISRYNPRDGTSLPCRSSIALPMWSCNRYRDLARRRPGNNPSSLLSAGVDSRPTWAIHLTTLAVHIPRPCPTVSLGLWRDCVTLPTSASPLLCPRVSPRAGPTIPDLAGDHGDDHDHVRNEHSVAVRLCPQ